MRAINWIFLNHAAAQEDYLWSMLRILILSLLFIALYRFIVRFVLPVFRITTAVRGQMKNMQQAQSQPPVNPAKSNRQKPAGDYIDYEEVR